MNLRRALLNVLAAGIALACLLLLAATRSSRPKAHAARKAPLRIASARPSCEPSLASLPAPAPAVVAAPQDVPRDDGDEERPPAEAWEHPGDSDGDGLLDDYERSVGLDPGSPDSDGDGLPDEDEEASPGVTHFEAQGRGDPSTGAPDSASDE